MFELTKTAVKKFNHEFRDSFLLANGNCSITSLRSLHSARTLHSATSDSIGTKTDGIRNPKGPNEEKWKWAGTFNYCTHFSFNTLWIKSKPPSPTTTGTRRNWSAGPKVLTSSDVPNSPINQSLNTYYQIYQNKYVG